MFVVTVNPLQITKYLPAVTEEVTQQHQSQQKMEHLQKMQKPFPPGEHCY